jgi:hypothetical protein
MPIEPFLIALFCACFAHIWTKELTDINGLFWFVPKIYPYPEKFLGKLLRCSICLSGWVSLAVSLCLGLFLFAIPTMFLTMTVTKCLEKI